MTGLDLSGLCPGTYDVTITDITGSCSAIESVIITEPLEISLSAAATPTTCAGMDGTATATATGGTGTITYAWDGGQTTQSISGLDVGTYTVTATDDNGCTATAVANVNDGCGCGNFSYQISQTDALCNGSCDGTVTITPATGTNTPYTADWSNNDSGLSVGNLCAGTYSVTITDANGCSAVEMVNINEPLEIVISTSSTPTTCAGMDGTATASAFGGIGTFTYAWSGGQNTQTISGLDMGTYTVTATDDNGCTATAIIEVLDGCACGNFSYQISQTDASCNASCDGTATVIPATGTNTPYTAIWSNNASGLNIGNLCAGTYSVTITDANGCSAIETVNINEPLEIILTTGATATTCAGQDGTATVSATGGSGTFTYAWTGGGNTQTISGLGIGIYTVTVTDQNGCTAVDTAEVTDGCGCGNFSYVIDQTDASCNGVCDGTGTIIATGSGMPYSATWSNGSIGLIQSNLCAGNYVVTITGSDGCFAIETMTINESPAILVAASSTATSCQGLDGTATAVGLGGTGLLSYTWSNAGTTETITGLDVGIYIVTVTDENGCTASAMTEVTNGCGCNDFSFTVAQTDVSCNGLCDGTATIIANGTSLPYTATWSNNNTGMTVGNLCEGVYSVTVTDNNGCSGISSIIISEPATLTVNINGNDASCGNQNGSVSANAVGGSGPYTYVWSNSVSGSTQNGLAGGTYTVTATDNSGCVTTGSVTISESLSFTLSGSVQDVTCNGGSDASINVTVIGGTPPYSYDWNNNETTEDISGLGAGNYILFVTDANDCTGGISFNVNEPNPISINMQVTNSNNDNGSISAQTTGGIAPYTWQWSNGATGVFANNLAPGIYSVTVTDANGCVAIAEAQVFDITNTEELSIVEDLNIYPNPNRGTFVVDLALYQSNDVEINIYNVLGQNIERRNYSTSELSETFELEFVANGTYFVQIIIGETRITEKITIIE